MLPQLQFDYGHMADGGASTDLHVFSWEETRLLEPSVRQGCQTPRRWTCPTWLLEQPHGRVIWVTDASVHTETKEFFSKYFTKLPKNVVQGWQDLRRVSPTQSHQSNGAAEKAIPTMRGLARTRRSPQTHNRVFRRNGRFANVDDDDSA